MSWLDTAHPELVGNYEAMYTRSNAPKAVTEPIQKSVANYKRALGYEDAERNRTRRGPKEASPEPVQQEQLSLGLEEPPRKAPRWVSEKKSAG